MTRAEGRQVHTSFSAPPVAAQSLPVKEPASLLSKSRVAGIVRPVPANPTRDAILAAMAAHPSFRAHPSETKKGGTKYVAAFRARNARTLAFDKAAASKQPIWMVDEPAVRALLETLRVSFDYYPPDKGRNSNLAKLSEFEARGLLRAFPNTQNEAIEIAEGVASL
ncbi:hypothetical protein LB518_24320 [Mesorhizobium sp. BR1-1-16]|uniref:hypothetical protein n=1 Tax=Mesorhizobium sp. BR1-1-16 TaxID=2876653 RepID=UPI001CC984D6|nr:hypothetical protein [Mesorhizobium sp. BR1-1-16]MBZ9939434.1 hypothetical protein [Mesorhizobium sp. BR1-1-16]